LSEPPEARAPLQTVDSHEAASQTVRLGIAVVVALSMAWMALSIRDGHTWYDDFAQYVMQAANTARFAPFADTAYIYDPASPVVGPRLYPPIFPLLLAPVYHFAGVNLFLFKLLCLACFLAALLVTLRLFRHALSPSGRLHYALIMGFSPVFWEMKDHIYSEHLFVPLFFGSILLMNMWYVRGSVFINPPMHALCLGLLMYLSFGTRTVGIVLLPTLVVCELVRAYERRSSVPLASVFPRFRRRIGLNRVAAPFSETAREKVRPTSAMWGVSLIGGGALLVALLLCTLQMLAMPQAGSGYADQLANLSPRIILKNLHANSTSFSLVWENGRNEWVRRVGGGMLMVLAVIGYLRCNIPRVSPLGVALVAYLTIVILWPGYSWLRAIWPVVPAFVFYMLVGSGFIARRVPRASVLPACIIVFTFGSYVSFYSGADFGPISNSIDSRNAKEMYAFVAAATSETEAVLFWKPRGLALYTHRRASKLPTRSPSVLLERAEAIGASLLVVRNDPAASETIVTRQIAGLHQVFVNDDWVVYRLPDRRPK
jgi:hypothetical protein